ncbi:MAG: molecular chaperone HtpG [Flavobacteriales bacterium]|nr:molecular chaperone HtpG [Flavobacteriales bacterium]MCB9447949.1 molecular chaperone HtpG [Flavobacteriales bacterium]
MQTGSIHVQSENIFPIIKKFLYSDHEIFLRELVSNAVDATQKLKTLASLGEFKGETGDQTIEVILDPKAKTLTFRDRGVGMTDKEVDKYINQIAFSGAEDFLKKYKNKADGATMIGHFGLGFYSSFMVAEKVEIFTKSFKRAKAVRWECDGSPQYTLEDTNRTERGTDIVLHITQEDAKEFLEPARIRELLNKYCKFMPVPITFKVAGEKEDAEAINNPEPAWTKNPSKLEDKDYLDFYRELYPHTFEEPLFHIHLNVDYPFNLTGILYFPKLKNNLELQRNKIQLYCNQVFVTDNVEGVVPEFLALLHGVIDSPDIPLNVSRSYLQSDANVKKISGHISKKVTDKLEEMFKADRADFEKKWDDIKIFIEYGMIADDKFMERARKFALLKTTDGKYYTLDEYNDLIKGLQTDKDNKVIYLYAASADAQHAYIEAAKERGYHVLILDSPLTGHFVGKLEGLIENSSFVRVDSNTLDKLIHKDDSLPSKLSEEQQGALKPILEKLVPSTFSVVFENQQENEDPISVVQPEFMRRMKEMNAVGGGGFMGSMPDSYQLVVNTNHPLISKILVETDEDKQAELARQATDLALLRQNMLKGEALTKFIKRNLAAIS